MGAIVIGIIVIVIIGIAYLLLRGRNKSNQSYGNPSVSYNSYGGNTLAGQARGAVSKLGDCCRKGIGKIFRGGA